MPRKIWMDPAAKGMKAVMPVVEVEWRIKVRHLTSTEFDDERKGVFLKYLQQHGKLAIACEQAGVLYNTYRQERQRDADFDKAIDHTLHVFKEHRVHRLEVAAMNGHTEPIFGPNGEVGERTRFESNLRAMVLKAYAPEMYNDKLEVEHKGTVGAVLVPADMLNDEAAWEAQLVATQSAFTSIEAEGVEAASHLLPQSSEVKAT